jgi:hypothetical protein
MRTLSRFLLSISAACILISTTSEASVTLISVKSVKVHRPFQVRRIDGRVITLKPESTAPTDLSGLPQPQGADSRLCGDLTSREIDRLNKQIDMIVALTRLGLQLDREQRKTLTRDEITLVKKSPRCEPFIPYLSLIAEVLIKKPQEKIYEVRQMQFTGGFFETPVLELMLDDWILDRGSRVYLSLPQLSYWSAGFIPAASTGQGVALLIEDLGENDEPDRGDESEGRERCTTPDGRPGHRYSTSKSVYYHRNWRLTFANSAGKRLMTAMITTLRTENEGREGPCRPFRRRR